ncbi:MAG: hypothetical protein ACO3JL_15655, partial [Myxococcota bacterium]
MRSMVAVIVGYLTLTLCLFVLFAVWFYDDADSGKPSWTFIGVAALWGFFASAAGGYLTGKIARTRPFEHAIVLAVAAGLIGVCSMAVRVGGEPVGFQLANLLILMGGCVVGGYLRLQRSLK